MPKLSENDMAVFYGVERAKFRAVPGVTRACPPGTLKAGEYTDEKAAFAHRRMGPVSEHVSDGGGVRAVAGRVCAGRLGARV